MSFVGSVSLLETARAGISRYLTRARDEGKIDQQLYEEADRNSYANLKEWLTNPHIDTVRPNLKSGIVAAIQQAEEIARTETDETKQLKGWESIVNAFRQQVRFGTGGIRGMMAFDRASIRDLADPEKGGIEAPILKGTNTINDLVFLLTSAGVAKYGRDRNPPFSKIVIGYDSRIGGQDLAKLIARLFIAYDYTVYLFDEPCPYPEVTFAIPYEEIKADVGILISASHNDYRYNGYKLSCANGSQFDPEERDAMYNRYIRDAKPEDVVCLNRYDSLLQAPKGRLVFLGGDEPVEEFDYGNAPRMNIHKKHREHVSGFFLTPDLAELQGDNPLQIGYCAFHGAGRNAVKRLLIDIGFNEPKIIKHRGLNDLDGLFPSFNYREGHEQQPDPGDPRAAEIIVDAFGVDHPGEFDRTDIIIGTDPDADRCGLVVKVPENQRHLYPKRYKMEEGDEPRFVVPISENEQQQYPPNDYVLLPADDAWALLLWYRLEHEKDVDGKVPDPAKRFIVLSHTTSDSIARLALKRGIGVVKTWVGFAALAAATRDVWDHKVHTFLDLVEGRSDDVSREYVRQGLCHPFICGCEGMDADRSINIGAMEQSNGFSILGGPPLDARSLGQGGHVRDKDGTFAALLLAEVAAWAKAQGTTLFNLIDEKIYLDVGLFVNLYEPDPLDGEYPGIEGDRKKKTFLRRALDCVPRGLEGKLAIGGAPVTSACIYRTGKYDAIYPPTDDFQFPDEGVRFFFDERKLDHVTVRPSGTGNSLRFHVQLHDDDVTKENLIDKKEQLHRKGKAVMDGIREALEAFRT